jgi:geranylgeranyl reductase family protein
MLDALVIGAGPSGAHFASQAAKKGYKVTLIEKGQLGRAKCCAGGLSGRFLNAYSVPPKLVEQEIRRFVMVSPSGERVELVFDKISGVTVNRADFDRWHVEQAIDCGCDLHLGAAAKKVAFHSDSVEVTVESGEVFKGRILIGAFGMAPQMLRQLGRRTPQFSLGLQAELTLPEAGNSGFGDSIEFHFNPKYSKAGYSWVFPKKQSAAIGLVTDPLSRQKTEALHGFIADYIAAHSNFTQHTPAKINGIGFGCAMLPNAPVEEMSGNRFMLLGDAAGLIDPTTWEGIYFAFKSADIALDAFERNYGKGAFSLEALSVYQANWKSKFGKELEHARSIQRRVYGERMGKLWKLIIHELNSDDKLRKLVTGELSRDMSITNMVEKIPLSTKLKLAAKYSRER